MSFGPPTVARGFALLALLVTTSGVGTGTPAQGQGLLEGLRRGVGSQAAFTRGKSFYNAHEYRGARDLFIEAVGLDPANDEAHALLAWSQYLLGDYRGAAITFKAALARQPTWEGLYDGLGWSRLRLGRYHLASEAFQSALDRNPDYVDALIGLGSAQFELGRYEGTIAPLQKALRRPAIFVTDAKELPVARAKLAWALYYVERYPEALATFARALRAVPDGHGLYNGIGWCYLKLGQKAEARSAFQRALALRADYEDAQEGLRQAGE